MRDGRIVDASVIGQLAFRTLSTVRAVRAPFLRLWYWCRCDDRAALDRRGDALTGAEREAGRGRIDHCSAGGSGHRGHEDGRNRRLFFSIDHARFYIDRSSRRRATRAHRAVAPRSRGGFCTFEPARGKSTPPCAGRDSASTRSVGAGPEIMAGKWENDDGDRRWIAPTPVELRNEIDHFHVPSDSVADRDTWAELALLQCVVRGIKTLGVYLVHVGGMSPAPAGWQARNHDETAERSDAAVRDDLIAHKCVFPRPTQICCSRTHTSRSFRMATTRTRSCS